MICLLSGVQRREISCHVAGHGVGQQGASRWVKMSADTVEQFGDMLGRGQQRALI